MKKLLIIVFVIFFSKESFADSIKNYFICTINEVCQKDIKFVDGDFLSLCVQGPMLTTNHFWSQRDFIIYESGKIEIRGHWFNMDIPNYKENSFSNYYLETEKYGISFALEDFYSFEIMKKINDKKVQIHKEEGTCEKRLIND
jgi:hypothetical protein